MKKSKFLKYPSYYAQIKNRIYEIYLDDVNNMDGNKVGELLTMIDHQDDEILSKIVGNTVEFPYDKELNEFMVRNARMSLNDMVGTAANLFGIDQELVVEKMDEYITFGYGKLLEEDLIKNEYVDELSRLYIRLNTKKVQKA